MSDGELERIEKELENYQENTTDPQIRVTALCGLLIYGMLKKMHDHELSKPVPVSG